MYRLVIAEKPSVAMSIAKVLGATARKEGHMEGRGSPVATSKCQRHLEAPTEPTGETGDQRQHITHRPRRHGCPA